MPIGIIAIVAIVFMGAPFTVFYGISTLRKQSMSKKQLELEKEKLELEKRKVRVMELQLENKLLDHKLEDEFKALDDGGEASK